MFRSVFLLLLLPCAVQRLLKRPCQLQLTLDRSERALVGHIQAAVARDSPGHDRAAAHLLPPGNLGAPDGVRPKAGELTAFILGDPGWRVANARIPSRSAYHVGLRHTSILRVRNVASNLRHHGRSTVFRNVRNPTVAGRHDETPLSRTRTCQLEKTENSVAGTWAAASNLGARAEPQRCGSRNGENVGAASWGWGRLAPHPGSQPSLTGYHHLLSPSRYSTRTLPRPSTPATSTPIRPSNPLKSGSRPIQNWPSPNPKSPRSNPCPHP